MEIVCKCFFCDNEETYPVINTEEAERYLVGLGWSKTVKGELFCPNCMERFYTEARSETVHCSWCKRTIEVPKSNQLNFVLQELKLKFNNNGDLLCKQCWERLKR